MKALQHFTIAIALFAFSAVAIAADRGTKAEAEAMVAKAVAYLKKNGKEAAFKAFSDQKGPFRDRDLYVAVIDMDGKLLAHGANEKMIGRNILNLMDGDGVYMVKKQIEVAKTAGKGSVTFKWPNPVTKEIESKTNYLESVGDFFIICGYYNT